MKRICKLLFASILLCCCEEAIDVDLENTEPRLVIDALIGYNDTTESPTAIGQVKLTLTAPFFDEEVPPARGATVRIIDESKGISYDLIESSPGIFNSGFPDIQFDIDYTLEVEYQDELYSATQKLTRGSKIDSISQGDGFLFDEDEETEIIISFTDIPNERNYYLFSFGFDNFLVTTDEFYQNSSLTFSYFYEEINTGQELTIILLGIDEQFASFSEQILAQSGQDGGGGFGTAPSSVRGNIVNETNIENYPFGYFAISEFDIAFFEVE